MPVLRDSVPGSPRFNPSADTSADRCAAPGFRSKPWLLVAFAFLPFLAACSGSDDDTTTTTAETTATTETTSETTVSTATEESIETTTNTTEPVDEAGEDSDVALQASVEAALGEDQFSEIQASALAGLVTLDGSSGAAVADLSAAFDIVAKIEGVERVAVLPPMESGLGVRGVHRSDDTFGFASGSTTLSAGDIIILDGAVRFLTDNPDHRVLIVGHTDDLGDDDQNMVLSQERALAGKRYLVTRKIDEDRITTMGKGETERLVEKEDAASRALNRRIVVSYSP